MHIKFQGISGIKICFYFRNTDWYSKIMASSKDFLEFVLEQLSGLPDIDYRAMMGEFVIYYHGKVVAGIYDNRLLVKPTPRAIKLMPDAPMEIPYKGGNPMIMITDTENPELLATVFDAVYADLTKVKKYFLNGSF